MKSLRSSFKLFITNLLVFYCIMLFMMLFQSGCAEKDITQVNTKAGCEEEKLSFMKQYLETTYDTVGGKDTCFIYQMWAPKKPILQLGDTIAVVLSAKYDYNGYPLIYDKPVYVTITTGFGDKETYWLKGKLLPGQTKLIDIEIFHGLISYNTFYVSHPSKEDNFLEIRPTGDTLIASYQSYCSGNIIKDTVVILPK